MKFDSDTNVYEFTKNPDYAGDDIENLTIDATNEAIQNAGEVEVTTNFAVDVETENVAATVNGSTFVESENGEGLTINVATAVDEEGNETSDLVTTLKDGIVTPATKIPKARLLKLLQELKVKPM